MIAPRCRQRPPTREYNTQALDAEKKKFKYGASTTALVLQQERSLAAAENTVTSAMATYAKDRASLEQILANTLTKYNISIGDGVSGTVTQQVAIPGSGAAPKNQSESALAPGAIADPAGDAAVTDAHTRYHRNHKLRRNNG